MSRNRMLLSVYGGWAKIPAKIPIRKQPDRLTTSVGRGHAPCTNLLVNTETRNRSMLPTPPPIPTNNSCLIIAAYHHHTANEIKKGCTSCLKYTILGIVCQ